MKEEEIWVPLGSVRLVYSLTSLPAILIITIIIIKPNPPPPLSSFLPSFLPSLLAAAAPKFLIFSTIQIS
jgi:hypothetical protein